MKDGVTEIRHGWYSSFVGIGEHNGIRAVYKYFKTQSKFNKELGFYKLLVGCPFVPELLHYDTDEKLLVLKYVGTTLDHKQPWERNRYKSRIKKMNDSLIKDYKIHHNDVRWKNITEDEDGNLYLLDFERSTTVDRGPNERDDQEILIPEVISPFFDYKD